MLDLLPAKACATAAVMEGWREETTEEVTEATEGEEEEEKVFLLDPLDPEIDLDPREREDGEDAVNLGVDTIEEEREGNEEEEPPRLREATASNMAGSSWLMTDPTT